MSLDKITNHGKETKVPNVTGKNLLIAIKQLKKAGFKLQIDSTYQAYSNPLEIIFQEPQANSTVKYGRTLFITVNRKSPPKIKMPNLVGLSFRNALLTMQSYRLEIGDTLFKPDIAAGSILEMNFGGKPLLAGQEIPIGSKIDLLVAEGLSTEEINVPNLIGSTWAEAKQTLEASGLTINVLWDGAITDTANAIVYEQQPESINELDFQNVINKGDQMDLRIMQSPTQEILNQHQPGSKKYFSEDDSTQSFPQEQPINQKPIAPIHKADTSNIKPRKVPGMYMPSAPLSENDKSKKNASMNNGTLTLKKKIPKKIKKATNTSSTNSPSAPSGKSIKDEYEKP